jgi:hypothetical protein
MHRLACVARFVIGAQLAALAAAPPAGAAPPETPAAPAAAAPSPPPYEYPPYPVARETTVDWTPPDGWRYPALVGDVVLVRPLMVISLIAGGALFVATLPISVATCTTRDWVHTLQDQAAYTFERPLGAF